MKDKSESLKPKRDKETSASRLVGSLRPKGSLDFSLVRNSHVIDLFSEDVFFDMFCKKLPEAYRVLVESGADIIKTMPKKILEDVMRDIEIEVGEKTMERAERCEHI